MKKLDGSELNMFERAKVNLCLADRVQSVFADAALEVELTEDDIKSTLLNYLNASTGKDWHLSSSVTLHGDIEVSQQIRPDFYYDYEQPQLLYRLQKEINKIARERAANLYKNDSHAVHIGINNKNNAFIGGKELGGENNLTHRNKQIEKETLQKLLMGGALAHEDITLEERANKIARSIKTAFLILEDN